MEEQRVCCTGGMILTGENGSSSRIIYYNVTSFTRSPIKSGPGSNQGLRGESYVKIY